ncbi:MAG: hypothetical protein HQK78_12615 [Desulfobacterales bacterium]|nr:hypothetical protein [Desulfobacterales bacterium]
MKEQKNEIQMSDSYDVYTGLFLVKTDICSGLTCPKGQKVFTSTSSNGFKKELCKPTGAVRN